MRKAGVLDENRLKRAIRAFVSGVCLCPWLGPDRFSCGFLCGHDFSSFRLLIKRCVCQVGAGHLHFSRKFASILRTYCRPTALAKNQLSWRWVPEKSLQINGMR